MKKKLIAAAIAVLSVGLLASCSLEDAYNFIYFIENAEGYAELPDEEDGWWDYEYDDDDYYGDDDDDDGRSSSSKNNSNSSSKNNSSSSKNNSQNSGSDELTFDDSSTIFKADFTDCASGEVAIEVKSENITDTNLEIPSTYVDSSGAKYKVVKDYGNGFSYLPIQRITLPEGFKEIKAGFDQCSYIKRIYLPSTITKINKEILTSCISLETIDFNGSKAEWNAIEKDSRWNYQAPAFRVSCNDGFIEVEKGPTT